MSIYTYNQSKAICECLGISFEENPCLSDQELNKIPKDASGKPTGGATTTGKMWITNGIIDGYIHKFEQIPEGWRRGRTTCVFNNSSIQKELGARADIKKRGESIKKAWDNGKVNRDHSKCGTKGDANPSKRPEVREKIRAAALSDSTARAERMRRVKPWTYK